MAVQPITVIYEELGGSPTEGSSGDVFTAERKLKCAWADRLTLYQQLKGGMIGEIYYQPYSYPDNSSALVTEIAIEPFDERVMPAGGTDLTRAEYSHAQLTVSYKTGSAASNPADNSKPVVEESIEPFAEFLTLPAAGFFWGSTTGDPLKDEEAPGKLFKGFNWIYTVQNLRTIPSAVFDLVGKVNDGAVRSYSLDYEFGAETLYYNPPILTRQALADGTLGWRLQYKFGFKPQKWTRFWRSKTKAWEQIFNAAGAADPYEKGDFTTLVG